MFFDPSKAIRELGLPQTPPRQAFEDAVQWFKRMDTWRIKGIGDLVVLSGKESYGRSFI
jgi:hypothetical protein